MKKSLELRQKKADVIVAMRGMLDQADTEKRSMTDEETGKYEAMEKSLDTLDTEIRRAEKLEAAEDESRTLITKAPAVIIKGKTEDDSEFRSFGDFVQAVVLKRGDDKRLQTVEYREANMDSGTQGGFMVPKQFRDTLLMIDPAAAVIRSRATVIPAGTPPDASMTMPALDQSTAQNVYGGMTVSWIAEGGLKPETNARIREITLTPHEVAAHTVITDKLLRNAPAFSGLLMTMLRKAIIGAEETAFITGNGVGKPLGILNTPAAITINRAVASQISFADLRNMFTRLKMGGNAVWVASQTILPQLMALVDPGASGTMIWQPSAREGVPSTLLGMPLIFNERAPALGTLGDLALADFGYYLIKDGSGPFISTDGGIVNFTTNKTLIKAFWNVDAQPWLNTPLPLEGSPTNTVSPFVLLDTP